MGKHKTALNKLIAVNSMFIISSFFLFNSKISSRVISRDSIYERSSSCFLLKMFNGWTEKDCFVNAGTTNAFAVGVTARVNAATRARRKRECEENIFFGEVDVFRISYASVGQFRIVLCYNNPNNTARVRCQQKERARTSVEPLEISPPYSLNR